MYPDLHSLITALITEIEAKAQAAGLPFRITGGSAQSCSTYLQVGQLAVRISDHDHKTQISEVNYHIGLGGTYGDDMVEVRPVYERMVCEFDEDGEEVSREHVECGEDDDDAEHVGYRVAADEIKRAATAVVAEAKDYDPR